MAKAGDLAAGIHFSSLFFESPDQKHTAIELKQLSLIHRQQRAFSDMFVTFQGHSINTPSADSASRQLKY
jgi:hypothetical protein